MPTFRQKGRGYNQKPYSGFLKTNDPENGAKGAEFNSYELQIIQEVQKEKLFNIQQLEKYKHKKNKLWHLK